MKKYLLAAFIAFTIIAAGSSADAQEKPWQLSVSARDIRWDASGLPDSGRQRLLYSQVAYRQERWGLIGSGYFAGTGYNSSRHDGRFSVSTLADISIASYYSKKFGKWNVRGGLDLDLPTGKNAYSSDDLAKIIVDPIAEDLMVLNSYGAGLNFAPHAVAIYSVSKDASAGAGFRYTVTGEYDTVTNADGDELDPGDRLLLLANGAVKLSNGDMVAGVVTWTHTAADTQGGVKSFDTGDTLSISGRYIHGWDEGKRTTFSAIYQSQAKNNLRGSAGGLVSEDQNSNNNSIELYANNMWRYSKKWTLTLIASVKNVDANGYAFGDALYDAGRRTYYIEPGALLLKSDDLYFTAKLRYTKIYDKKDAFAPADAVYGVINLELGAVWRF